MTVISQCELWTDNANSSQPEPENKAVSYSFRPERTVGIVTEEPVAYGSKK